MKWREDLVSGVALIVALALLVGAGCAGPGTTQGSEATTTIAEGAHVGKVDQAPRQAGVESGQIEGGVATAVYGLDPGTINVILSALPMVGKGVGAVGVFFFGLFIALAFARSIAPNVMFEIIGVAAGCAVALGGPIVLLMVL